MQMAEYDCSLISTYMYIKYIHNYTVFHNPPNNPINLPQLVNHL